MGSENNEIFPNVKINFNQFADIIRQRRTLHFTTESYCDSIMKILNIFNNNTNITDDDFENAKQEEIDNIKKSAFKKFLIDKMPYDYQKIEDFKRGDALINIRRPFGNLKISENSIKKMNRDQNDKGFKDFDILFSGLPLDETELNNDALSIYNDLIIFSLIEVRSINKMYGLNIRDTENIFIWDDNQEPFIGIETLLQAIARAGRGDSENKLVNAYIPYSYSTLFNYENNNINVMQ